MKILVAGATGYIGSKLIPRLLARGYSVRALARSPQKLEHRAWRSQVEVAPGDALQPETLAPAMREAEAAYYLIHNMTLGRGYTQMETRAARNFAQAAAAAGVKHIIYLGGLADSSSRISSHMRSRIETGKALRSAGVPVTEFRAGVILGNGSASFEMIRFMAELLPVIPGPLWMNNKTQPIAEQNVMDYLIAALENPEGRGQVYEIGGPRVFAYRELMETFARARGLKRKVILLPFLPVELMAFGVELLTPIPRPVARALLGGLAHDSVARDSAALQTYSVRLIEPEAAAEEALRDAHPYSIERVWQGELRRLNPFKHEGFFIDQREAPFPASAKKTLDALARMALPGFAQESQTETSVLFRAESEHGRRWVEYRVVSEEDVTRLVQVCYFAPRGFAGFLRAYGLYFFSGALLAKTLKALR